MLEYIHRAKTAALITANPISGGIYAGAKDREVKKLRAFGQSIGLAFQIVDDVLDVNEEFGATRQNCRQRYGRAKGNLSRTLWN